MLFDPNTPRSGEETIQFEPRYRTVVNSQTGERVKTDRLSTNQARIFEYLLQHPNRIIPPDELRVKVYKRNSMNKYSIYNTFRLLRSNVEFNPNEPMHLFTIYGEGFLYIPGKPQPIDSDYLRNLLPVEQEKMVNSIKGKKDPQGLQSLEGLILDILETSPGKIWSNEALVQEVLQRRGTGRALARRSLNTYIYNMRRKLGAQGNRIVTVGQRGYTYQTDETYEGKSPTTLSPNEQAVVNLFQTSSIVSREAIMYAAFGKKMSQPSLSIFMKKLKGKLGAEGKKIVYLNSKKGYSLRQQDDIFFSEKEQEILNYIQNRQGTYVSIKELRVAIWLGREVSPGVIVARIGTIRKKLPAGEREKLCTKRRLGYTWQEKASERVPLPAKPNQSILLALLRASDSIVSKEQIKNAIWQGETVPDQYVYNLITQVRKTLPPQDKEMLHTIPTKGYLWAKELPEELRLSVGQRILQFFKSHEGALISIEELVKEIWPGKTVSRGYVNSVINQIRKNLPPQEGGKLKTVVGYRWEE